MSAPEYGDPSTWNLKVDQYLDATDIVDRENFAIGGGQFQGTNLGTREGFSNYTKRLVTPQFFKASKTNLQDLTAAERKLFREGNLFYTKIKGKGGNAGVNFFGDSQKIDTLLGTVPEDISNLPDELSGKSVTAQKIRKRFIKEYLEELPKGDVINLDATTRILDEKISEATNGRIRMKDKTALQNFLNDEELNTNEVRGPLNIAEAKDIQMKKYPSIDKFDDVQKQADELNTKYKLNDKGIKFVPHETSTGKVGMRLSFTGEPFRDIGGGRSLDAAPDFEGISKLETELKKIIKTDAFKNYSAKEASKKGSEIAGSKKLKYNQSELFEYLLNKEGPVSKEQVIKDFKKFGYDQGVLRKAIGNLHANMYRALDPNQPGSGKFLSNNYNSNQIKSVLDKVKNNFAGDYFNRTFENLLVDAYGDVPKKYKPLADKLKKFRELQKELKKSGVEDEFIAQLDHVIPFNFLQLVREGKNPEELLRVKAYPGTLNSGTFKGAIDGALGRAVEKKDKKLIKTITELRNFLPEDMGEIDSTGKKVIDYKAKPFNLKTIYSDQQEKFGEVYKRTQEFMDNPKVINLLKDAGISLRAISQLKKLNVPGFLNTFNELKKARPELFVGVENDFNEIENQYASLNTGTMSDVSPVKKEEKDPFPYEAALPLAGALGKYAKPLLKGAFKTIGSAPSAVTFAGMEIKKGMDEGKTFADAATEPLVGIELLYPELFKKAGLGFNALNKLARVTSPVGVAVTGGGVLKNVITDSEPNLLIDKETGEPKTFEREDASFVMPTMIDMNEQAYKLSKEKGISYEDAFRELAGDKTFQEGIESLKQKYAIGGRVNFADGPEDPKKRKFMKIMGGLATLPIVGRLFDVAQVAEKTAPVVKETLAGAPDHFISLYNLIKKLGKDAKYTLKDREIVTELDDYVLSENLVTGEKIIQRNKMDDNLKYDSSEYFGTPVQEEVYMSYTPGKGQMDETMKGKTPPNEYIEDTALVRNDKPARGEIADTFDGIPDDVLEDIKKYTYDK